MIVTLTEMDAQMTQKIW